MATKEKEPVQIYLEPENADNSSEKTRKPPLESVKVILESVSHRDPIEFISDGETDVYQPDSNNYMERAKDAISIFYQDIEPSQYDELSKLIKKYSGESVDRKILTELLSTKISENDEDSYNPDAQTHPGDLRLT